MRKRILATLLAIIMAGSASLAIYAGVVGFGDDSGRVDVAIALECYDANAVIPIVPFGPGDNIIANGGSCIWCPPRIPCCLGRTCGGGCFFRYVIGLGCNC